MLNPVCEPRTQHVPDRDVPGHTQQSGYNKCLRAAGTLISATITALANDTPSCHDVLRLVDSTPLPCGMLRETVKRSDLARHAGYGYCASHSRYFWGFRLYLISTPEGMPVIWGPANPKVGEREVAQAPWKSPSPCPRRASHPGRQRLRRQRLRTVHPHLIRPDRKDEKPRFGNSTASGNGSNHSLRKLDLSKGERAPV